MQFTRNLSGWWVKIGSLGLEEAKRQIRTPADCVRLTCVMSRVDNVRNRRAAEHGYAGMQALSEDFTETQLAPLSYNKITQVSKLPKKKGVKIG